MEANKKVKELIAEHRELEKLIPLHTPKPRKRVAKSELWSRSEREELSRLAEAFVKAKQPTTRRADGDGSGGAA